MAAPANCPRPRLGYALSLTGWLLVPGLTGAAAGYIIMRQIERRRSTALGELLRQMRAQSGGPGPPSGDGT
ncbi:DUF6313 family protein [Streptomyces sp. B1-3]|uniref:DUF6313 family protein n=1 Tax=Streptomyces sp. B1-3 TaxID=3141453 RepID=UPI003D2CB6F0